MRELEQLPAKLESLETQLSALQEEVSAPDFLLVPMRRRKKS